MEMLGLNATVTGTNLSSHTTLVAALNTTCELQHSKDVLIPKIRNDSVVVSVVKQLNIANINDSCQWLNDVIMEISGTRGNQDCSNTSTTANICKRWSGILKFKDTLDRVKNLPSAGRTNPCGWITMKEQASPDLTLNWASIRTTTGCNQ